MGSVADPTETIGAVDGPAPDLLVDLLVVSARAATHQLSSIELEPATEDLRQIIATELERGAVRELGFYVRTDRGPRARRGTWRFSLLIEAPDRVLAAVEVSAAPDDIEHEMLALARLTAGIERGVAERGFLISASHKGRGLAVSRGRAKAAAHPHEAVPFTRFFQWRETPWQLVVIEADQEAKESTR